MIEVRRARVSDIPAGLRLYGEGLEEDGRGVRLSPAAAGFLRVVVECDYAAAWLAWEGSEVVGGVIAQVDPMFEPTFGEVVKLYVRPRWRGGPAATMLLAVAEGWALRNGAVAVHVHGHFGGPARLGYQALVRRCGYRPVMSVWGKEVEHGENPESEAAGAAASRSGVDPAAAGGGEAGCGGEGGGGAMG